MPLEQRDEQRISDLERHKDLLGHQLDTISSGIAELKAGMASLNGLASRVQTTELRLEAAWKKIDMLQQCKEDFNMVRNEHLSCKPKVETMDDFLMEMNHRLKIVEEKVANSGKFAAKLWESISEKLIWALISGGAATAIYLAGKGVFKP